jgi:type IX secretion system PorP/SprF family membrane protein
MAFDVGLGGYYHSDNLYLGVSATHITNPTFHFTSGAPFTVARTFYITPGYNLALQDPAFEIQPSAILRLGGGSSSVDLSSLVVYNKRIWAGVSYRINAAIVCIFGLEMNNGIRFGYSYDISTNILSASTHEIMLSYSFSLVKEKILHKYRSVRFL